MFKMIFRNSLRKFHDSLQRIDKSFFDESKTLITDFKEKKKQFKVVLFRNSYKELINSSAEITLSDLNDETKTQIKNHLASIKEAYEENNLDKIKEIINELLEIDSTISHPKSQTSFSHLSFKIKNIPEDISDDMHADLHELEKCFKSDCFRASIILCGRLLETSLHRKFFETTNQDILEKNPGIGLGTLVAKLKEKDILLDPAITQQIHLINQVRIYSVHRKKQTFSPTKDQTQAIILYTLEVIRKLF